MLDWLWTEAGRFGEVAAALVIVGTAAAFVIRKVVQVQKQVVRVIAAVERIEGEFKPNGGITMRDQFIAMKTMIWSITARQWALVDGLGDPMWESDGNGLCIRANRAIQKLVGRSESSLLGANWENIIEPSDRRRVWQEWSDAVARRRAFEATFKVVSTDGEVYQVDAMATPIADGINVSGWLGKYRRVELCNGENI